MARRKSLLKIPFLKFKINKQTVFNILGFLIICTAIVFFIGQTLCLVMKLPFKKLYILYAVFFIIGLSAIYEARTYFVFQSLVFPASFELHRNLLQPYLDGNYLFDPAKINKL